MRLPPRPFRGVTLFESLASLAVLFSLVALGLPVVAQIGGQAGLRAACNQVASHLHQARSRAAARRVDVGVRWVAAGGDATLYVYEDGNGNGVLSADVLSGVDRLVAGPYSLRVKDPSISFSFFPGFHGPDPGGSPIGNLADPYRLGEANMTTFSAVGHASPGTVYLSDGRGRQGAVRISPGSGRIQLYEWRPGSRRWEPV